MIRRLEDLREALEKGEALNLFDVSSGVVVQALLENIAGDDEVERRLSGKQFLDLKRECHKDRSMADVLADLKPGDVDDSELDEGEKALLEEAAREAKKNG